LQPLSHHLEQRHLWQQLTVSEHLAASSKYLLTTSKTFFELADILGLEQEYHKLPSTMPVKKSTERDQGLSFSGAYENLVVEVRNEITYNGRLFLTWLICESIYVKSC
jgi:hypothetical protein